MYYIAENRASVILYNFLLSNKTSKKYLLPANVCPIVPLVFLKARTPFEFCDIDQYSLSISKDEIIAKLERALNMYAGLMFVRNYGKENDETDFFLHIKSSYPNIIIIDDKCLCAPKFEESKVADLSLYSTGYEKYVDIGIGGFAYIDEQYTYYNFQQNLSHKTTNFNHNYFDQIAKLNNSISSNDKFIYNDSDWLDMSEVKLVSNYKEVVEKHLKVVRQHKKLINSIYAASLPQSVQLDESFNNWRFNIIVKNKDKILNDIFNNNLFASSHYPVIGKAFVNKEFPISTSLHGKIINLFNNNKITEETALKLAETIKMSL